MTNINGIKTIPLGAIDNFPITVGTVTSPIKVDVTDATTYSVIAGNDWLMQVKATIDYDTANLTIRNGEKRYQIPCTYMQDRTHVPQPIVQQSNDYYIPEDNDTLDDEEEYLHVDIEPVATQVRSLKDIDWKPLELSNLLYLPRRTFVKMDKHGIAFQYSHHDWSSIRSLHVQFQ
jgi:hypothetical protein